MAYNFTAKWIKGSANDAPDSLSRNPVSDPRSDDTLAEFDAHNEPAFLSITKLRAITIDIQDNLKLQDVQHHAANDPEYQQLCDIILQGFPDHRSQLSQSCRPYWNVRKHLTIDDDLIVYRCHLQIQSAVRHKIYIHESH